ncbi:Alpha/Beta hydrolase protein [Aspergillus egyptiacus]|nr:Alpha/Beta hydrolase protein [Aspergillus egyptiacus]
MAIRDYQSGLSAVQIQQLLPSTSKACARFAARHGIPISEIVLPGDTVALKLGRSCDERTPKRVLVYFHGGGYMSPATSEHIAFPFGFDPKRAVENGVCVIVLPYGKASDLREDVRLIWLSHLQDLAAEHKNHYPRQLEQAVSLMAHLLHGERIPASAITLLGDSAGGHLLLSLLLHLSHPNPRVPRLDPGGRFSAAVLLSPWVDMHSSAESMLSNKHKDILSAAALAYWARNFMGLTDPDYWNSPLTAPPKWWGSVPVERMLTLYGDRELFCDDIRKFSAVVKEAHQGFLSIEVKGEMHEHMIMSRLLCIGKSCESERILLGWLYDHLGVAKGEGT